MHALTAASIAALLMLLLLASRLHRPPSLAELGGLADPRDRAWTAVAWYLEAWAVAALLACALLFALVLARSMAAIVLKRPLDVDPVRDVGFRVLFLPDPGHRTTARVLLGGAFVAGAGLAGVVGAATKKKVS